MNTKRYTGSCHCKAVRFEADIDLSQGTVKCNCSMCAKIRGWGAIVRPSAFHLLCGEDALSKYQFNTNSIEHLFCKHCGVRPFGNGDLPQLGGKYHSVNLGCLDNASDDELASAPVKFCNGRDNAWQDTPAQTKHL